MNKRMTALVPAIIFLILAVMHLTGNKEVPEAELWDSYRQFSEEKNDTEAAGVLNKILDQNPDNSIALNNIAIDYIRKNQLEMARASLMKAEEHAGEYRMSETVPTVESKNMAGELTTFYLLYPGELPNTIRAVARNLYMLTSRETDREAHHKPDPANTEQHTH